MSIYGRADRNPSPPFLVQQRYEAGLELMASALRALALPPWEITISPDGIEQRLGRMDGQERRIFQLGGHSGDAQFAAGDVKMAKVNALAAFICVCAEIDGQFVGLALCGDGRAVKQQGDGQYESVDCSFKVVTERFLIVVRYVMQGLGWPR